MPRLFLGVDAGQTVTTAVIGDALGQILGEGDGGQSNRVKGPEGRIRLIRAATDALSGACKQAGFAAGGIEFESACLGFTGAIADQEPVLRVILMCRRMLVTDDAVIALAGARGNRPGIVAITGTGAVVMGRNAGGATARAGGWGHLFGNEGAGWGIAREGLRAARRFHEEWGPPTLLHDLFLEQTGGSDIHVLRRRSYTDEYPTPRVAAFSRLIDHAAARGDLVAPDILYKAAQSLADLVQVVRRRLFGPLEPVPVSPVGGAFESRFVMDRFQSSLEAGSGIRVVPPKRSPVIGALLEAIRIAGS